MVPLCFSNITKSLAKIQSLHIVWSQVPSQRRDQSFLDDWVQDLHKVFGCPVPSHVHPGLLVLVQLPPFHLALETSKFM